MEVSVTLYKTGFTPADVFVGSTASNRLSELESSFQSLSLGSGAFNPLHPFRIAGNWLDYQRKWDYARIDYISGDVTTTRFYFITGFNFVNDNVCDMQVREDILGQVFYDLQVFQCLPDSYTYKQEDLADKIYTSEAPGELYNYDFLVDYSLRVTMNSKQYLIGALMLTVDGGSQGGETSEDFLRVPVNTCFMPFAFDLSDKVLYNAFRWEFLQRNASGDDGYATISPISDYIELTKSENVSVIKSAFFLDLGFYLTARVDTTGTQPIIYLDPNDNVDGTNTLIRLTGARGLASITSYKSSQNVSIPNVELPEYLRKKPFFSVGMSRGRSAVEIDPLSLPETSNSYELEICISLLPPYNYSIGLSIDETSQPYRYTINAMTGFSNDDSFLDYSDSYTEFLRTNYNSQIMGLKARQDLRDDQNTLNFGRSLGRAGISLVADLTEQGLINAGRSIAGNALDSFFTAQGNELQAQYENQLQQYQLQDVANTPDKFSFGKMVLSTVLQQGWLRLYTKTPATLDQLLVQIAMYGVKAPKYITTLRSHQNFDYIRVSNIKFTNIGDVVLTESEYSLIYSYFRAGVRVWYSAENFKKTTNNPEVS